MLTDVTTPSPVLWQLAFNLDDPVVGNPDIRRALALATDRVELAADSVNFSDPLNIGASSRVFGEGQPGAAAELFSDPRYNPVAAARLFRSLGYVPDAAGDLRTYAFSAPLTLTLTGPSGDAVVDSLELQLQAEWAASGVELVIHNVSTDELLTRVLPEGSYQVALAPYSIPVFPSWNALMYTDPVLPASPPTPVGSLDPRGVVSVVTGGSSQADPSVGLAAGGKWLWSMPTRLGTEPGAGADGVVTRDITGLDDPRVGRFFEEAMSDLNTTVQAQTLSKLDNLLSHDLPTLPLFQQPVSLVQRSRPRERQRKSELGGAALGRGGLGDSASAIGWLRAPAPDRGRAGRSVVEPRLGGRWAGLRYSTTRLRGSRRARVGGHVGVAE